MRSSCIIGILLSALGEFDVTAVTTPSNSWDFRGCSSATVSDSVGGIDVTIQSYGVNSICSSDGLYMNGDSTSYASTSSYTWSGASGMSWEVYANVEALGFWFRFFDFGQGGDNDYDSVNLCGRDTTDNIFFNVYPSQPDETYLIAKSFITTGEWLHIVVTISTGGVYNIYKNGELNATRTGGAIPANVARTSNYIGKSNFGTSDANFQGTFGYLNMWVGTELSATDASDLYAVVAPTPQPTPIPTVLPVFAPTPVPSSLPIFNPTPAPTIEPSPAPTPLPNPQPTMVPISQPSPAPTLSPIPLPTMVPISQPSPAPTLSPIPQPTMVPTSLPTPTPSMQPTYSPQPTVTQQPTILVASKSWDFRGCSSSTVADSITGLVATIQSYGTNSICSSDGLYLNGDSTSYVYIADPWYWDGTSGASWEIFANVESLGFWFRYFDFGNPSPYSNTVHLSGRDTSDDLFFDVYPSASEETTFTVKSFITTGEWLHIVVTVSSDGVYNIYKNGELNATRVNGSVPAAATRTSNYIGRSNFNTNDATFQGTFGYLNMWEGIELSASYISSLYDVVAPTPQPTASPTLVPSPQPTLPPSPGPTVVPSSAPSITLTPTPGTPHPSQMPSYNPTSLPVFSPTAVPIPSPTKVPIPSPTALPTAIPTPSPTQVPIPSPTASPSVSFPPTTPDTVSIDSSLTMVADNEDDVTESIVISSIVSVLSGITAANIFDFRLSFTTVRRLRSRSLLAVQATASFTIRASLSDVGYVSAGEFSSQMNSQISSAISDGSLTAAMETACGDCTLEASSITTTLAQNYPTVSPTLLPTPVPTTTPKKGDNKDGPSAASIAMLGGIAAAGLLFLAGAVYCGAKQYKKSKDPASDQWGNDRQSTGSSSLTEVEMAPTTNRNSETGDRDSTGSVSSPGSGGGRTKSFTKKVTTVSTTTIEIEGDDDDVDLDDMNGGAADSEFDGRVSHAVAVEPEGAPIIAVARRLSDDKQPDFNQHAYVESVEPAETRQEEEARLKRRPKNGGRSSSSASNTKPKPKGKPPSSGADRNSTITGNATAASQTSNVILPTGSIKDMELNGDGTAI